MVSEPKQQTSTADSAPSELAKRSESETPKKRTRRWGLRRPWLLVPLAILVSIILAMAIVSIGMGIGPSNRSLSLGIAMITFPLISGTAMNYCIGHKRPWRALRNQFLVGLLGCVVGWGINYLRWQG